MADDEKNYGISFTHAARVDAQRFVGGLSALERRVREEIDGLIDTGLKSADQLIFHTILAKDGPEFLCFGTEGGIEVDACEQSEPSEPLAEGPFKGKRVVIPKGFSS